MAKRYPDAALFRLLDVFRFPMAAGQAEPLYAKGARAINVRRSPLPVAHAEIRLPAFWAISVSGVRIRGLPLFREHRNRPSSNA